MRALYSLLMMLMLPLLRRRLAQRGRDEPGYLVHPAERWGDYRHLVDEGSAPSHVWNESSLAYRPTVWVHAVSLGETRAAALLLAELRQLVPGMRLLLTHGTATGREEGKRLLQAEDRQVWLPWDTPQAVDRFLNRFQPVMGVLMETEVWPNLAAACASRHLPLVLVNARLSEQSLRKAKRLAWLSRPAYGALNAVFAQTEVHAERLRCLGAPVQGVFGNIKFDANPPPALLAKGARWRADWLAGLPAPKVVVVFAVSREGEEALLLQQLTAFDPAQRKSVQWLIVPRHPQRFDEVAALVRGSGLSLSRRSEWGDGAPALADVWLGDSLGEMAAYYGLSDLALLGGSFLPLGGQNLIEAAACHCPVVMGQHTFNFEQAAQDSAQAGAAFEVNDLNAGIQTAFDLLQNRERLEQSRRAATAFVAQHKGAAAKTATALRAKLH